MKPVHILIGIALLLVGMSAAITFKSMGAGEQEGRGGGERAALVQAAQVEKRVFADTVEAVGTVRAEESVAITANVADTVTEINFDSGDTIGKGDVLLKLADAEERADLADATAALAESRNDTERLEQLSRNNAVSRSELDQSRSALQRSRAQLGAVKARLANYVIRAPFDGRVGLRDVSVGAYVGPGDVLLTLDQIGNVDLDFTVPERFIAVLERGLPVRAVAAAYPDDRFDGEITDIDTRVDPVTRAVTVRARLPNEDGRLRPGMLLGIEIRRDERESPAIPEIAVMRNGEQVSVFGIEASKEGEGKRAVRHTVKLGARDGTMIEVLEGLKPGDTFVSKGMHRATDGGPVEVKGARENERAADEEVTAAPENDTAGETKTASAAVTSVVSEAGANDS